MDWNTLGPVQLEYEYNPRVTVPDFADYFVRLSALAEETRTRLPQRFEDVRYGTGELQTLDIFPADRADAPVHVFFHGGYWRSQDKRDYAFVARDLVPRGITVVVANYDLCPAVTVPAINAQCVDCIVFLRENIGRYGISSGPLTVSGHSAGGQIVARLLTHDWGGSHPVSAALAISGVFDVTPIVHTSLNDVLGLDEASARACSPLYERPPATSIPLRLAVGGAESEAFHRQSADYAAHAGVQAPIVAPAGRNHFDVLEALFLADSEAFDTVAGVCQVAP